MTTTEEGVENIRLFELDQGLTPYKDHFAYRIQRYAEQKKLIETYEGSLEDFSLGKDEIEH